MHLLSQSDTVLLHSKPHAPSGSGRWSVTAMCDMPLVTLGGRVANSRTASLKSRFMTYFSAAYGRRFSEPRSHQHAGVRASGGGAAEAINVYGITGSPILHQIPIRLSYIGFHTGADRAHEQSASAVRPAMSRPFRSSSVERLSDNDHGLCPSLRLAALDLTVVTARGVRRWADDYNRWAVTSDISVLAHDPAQR